jgi:endonuclease III
MPTTSLPVKVYSLLKKEFGEVSCPLHFTQNHELAIAVILSAQCTDERVNLVTPELFKKYPSLEAFSKADLPELESLIYSTGFYKNKAKSILGFSKQLISNFNSELPKTIEELTTLPGIGRKTANVILNEIYKITEGIVVDTHVKRISKILKFSKETDVVKIEQDLMRIFPKKYWLNISLYIIFLGRKYCKAGRPDCNNCVLQKICPGARIK